MCHIIITRYLVDEEDRAPRRRSARRREERLDALDALPDEHAVELRARRREEVAARLARTRLGE